MILQEKIRPCRSNDLQAVWEIFLISFRDMIWRVHGTRGPLSYSRKAPSYLSHVLATDPRSFWVAESNGKLVGFSCAIVRGPIWFLSDFWILPPFRGRGIGKKLLRRSLQSDKRYRIISTYSSLFPTAMRSYIMLGMTPRFPVYTLVAKSDELKLKKRNATTVEIFELNDQQPEKVIARGLNQMSAIDEIVRGSARREDHDFFVRRSGMRCWLVKERRQTTGYFYISPKGQIGPLGVRNARNKLQALFQAIREGARCHSRLTFRIPASNIDSIRFLMDAGFRIDSHAIFMSSAEFGSMENYIISGPALF